MYHYAYLVWPNSSHAQHCGFAYKLYCYEDLTDRATVTSDGMGHVLLVCVAVSVARI